MVELLARNWKWIALRGALGILFGVLTFLNPSLSLGVIVALFGAYALVDGIFTTVAAVADRRELPRWGTLVAAGVLGILAGIVTFTMPRITALALIYLVAIWAIVIGIAHIAAAIRLRKVISGEWLLILAGVLGLIFGAMVLAFPRAGALAVVLWIGAYAFFFGILQVALALRLKRWTKEEPPQEAEMRKAA